MTDWIDVKIRLPDKDNRYLACCGDIFIARYTKSSNIWKREMDDSGREQHVTHWMPMPPLPRK